MVSFATASTGQLKAVLRAKGLLHPICLLPRFYEMFPDIYVSTPIVNGIPSIDETTKQSLVNYMKHVCIRGLQDTYKLTEPVELHPEIISDIKKNLTSMLNPGQFFGEYDTTSVTALRLISDANSLGCNIRDFCRLRWHFRSMLLNYGVTYLDDTPSYYFLSRNHSSPSSSSQVTAYLEALFPNLSVPPTFFESILFDKPAELIDRCSMKLQEYIRHDDVCVDMINEIRDSEVLKEEIAASKLESASESTHTKKYPFLRSPVFEIAGDLFPSTPFSPPDSEKDTPKEDPPPPSPRKPTPSSSSKSPKKKQGKYKEALEASFASPGSTSLAGLGISGNSEVQVARDNEFSPLANALFQNKRYDKESPLHSKEHSKTDAPPLDYESPVPSTERYSPPLRLRTVADEKNASNNRMVTRSQARVVSEEPRWTGLSTSFRSGGYLDPSNQVAADTRLAFSNMNAPPPSDLESSRKAARAVSTPTDLIPSSLSPSVKHSRAPHLNKKKEVKKFCTCGTNSPLSFGHERTCPFSSTL